jgi:2-polyprenyl-6-methoxyphenol hydroxylase-like FAD-dependent oxidoreductase
MKIIVLGASFAGLSTALMLSRAGHQVQVLERDGRPMPAGPLEAIGLVRPTVPQYQQAHSLSAAGRGVLLRHLPDVVDDLRRHGAQEFHLINSIPATALGRRQVSEQQTQDLVVLGVRRSMMEWALNKAAARQPRLTVHRGVLGSQPVWDEAGGRPGSVPRAVGVRTRGRGDFSADLVVDATGRRSLLSDWARLVGVKIPRLDLDCEITAHTRFFRLRDVTTAPRLLLGYATNVALDGCSGYVFGSDRDVVAVAFGRHPRDRGLAGLHDSAAFDAALSAVPFVGAFVQPEHSVPISDVNVMAGLRSTFLRLAPDGVPLLRGLVPVGDALATTNPAYGRGLSLALRHAEILTEALAGSEQPNSAAPSPSGDSFDQVYARLDGATYPTWYDAYRHDCMRIDTWRATLGLPIQQRQHDRPWLSLPLAMAGARVDAQVYTRFFRAMQLLDVPTQFFGDLNLIDRLPQLVQAPPPPLATRADVVAAMEAVQPLQVAS